jgi:acetyl esterase
MPDPFIRPDVRLFLDYLNGLPGPHSHEVGPEGARQMMIASRYAADAEVGELAIFRDFEGPGAAGPIRLRLYDARAEREAGPLLVFFHGGGFVIGDLETHDPLCAELARGLDLPVAAVDYRLAPEHPFPAGIDDCIAAARWLADGPEALGRQPTGLVLAGDSAGGNFTIVATLALRDRPAAVPVIAQWPIYPAADPGGRYPSYKQFCEGHLLTRAGMNWFEECYAGQADDWRFSPLLKSQEGMSPTFVLTAGLDPIRDQGRAYAAACVQAGVQTTYLEAQGTIHGFLSLRKAIPSANEDMTRCLTLMKALIEAAR